MNDKFVRARGIFDAAMEESLSRHNPGAHSHEYTQSRPEYQVVQQQAQQDYSAQWAQYYATLHAQGQAAQSQQQAVHPQQAQSQEAQQQADAYAKWYWSQQQQQQAAAGQPQAGAPIVQVQSPTPQSPQAPMSLPSPQAQGSGSNNAAQDPNAPHDSEKRLLYERAR